MASSVFAVSIDLTQNELQNAAIHNLASAPSSPVNGQIYFDTTLDYLRVYNGTSWINLLDSEGLQDTVGAMVSGNTETGIAVTYDDTSGVLNFVVGTLDTLPAPADDLSLNSQKITDLSSPVDANDATNKDYVDTTAGEIYGALDVEIDDRTSADNLRVLKAGDTMTGNLTVASVSTGSFVKVAPTGSGLSAALIKGGVEFVAGGTTSAAITVSDDGIAKVVEDLDLYTLGTLIARDPVSGSEVATKDYADGLIAAADALVFIGVINCSSNPNYPAADAGHFYKVSVAGKIGGASGPNVEVGDTLVCTVDGSDSDDHASVGANWAIIQTNIDGAVTGPSSATDGRVATFDGSSGKVIRDGGTLLSALAPLASPTGSGVATWPIFSASGDTGATAGGRFVGATASGAPTTGAHSIGDYVIARDGHIWVCTSAGTPGTWVEVGSLLSQLFVTGATSLNQFAIGEFGGFFGWAMEIDGQASSNTYMIEPDLATGLGITGSTSYVLLFTPGDGATYDAPLFRSGAGELKTTAKLIVADATADTHAVNRQTGDARYVLRSLVDAKGDLFTATADNTPARLAVGTDGYVLTADSGESTGIKWAAAAADGGGAETESNIIAGRIFGG